MKIISKITIILFSIVFLFTACEKDFLEPDLTQYATGEQIAEIGETSPEAIAKVLIGMLNGVYAYTTEYQNNHDVFGVMAIGLAGDLMTEDIAQLQNHWFYYDYQIDNRNSTYRRVTNAWTTAFTIISKSNEIITKIDPGVSDPTLKAYLGQALALRAYGYFLAIQRFQQTYKGNEQALGVPIYLTPQDEGYNATAKYTREPVQKVYDLIINDLERATALLNGYQRPAKSMINREVAAGLLAKVYLVTEDWAKAANYAKIARTGYSLMTANEVAVDGFNDINNKEWMWGADITSETTTMFASFFSHVCTFDAGYGGDVGVYKAIDKKLFEQIGNNDTRRKQFKVPGSVVNTSSSVREEQVPIYTNFKFKKVTGWLADYVYMRVPEMYLIEAEALVRSGNATEGANVLGQLMANRDPDWKKTTITAEDVFLQKRIELWGEGHIFYDYLRLKKGVDRNYEGTNHLEKIALSAGDWRFIYQIPQTEIDNNPDINDADQNP
ncbi:membrane protein [Bacteroidia bacterium]|nr:membrane protein [Bacteroidia bacterium]GHV70697.1 membrane protein [Bacteroidia bacterium]